MRLPDILKKGKTAGSVTLGGLRKDRLKDGRTGLYHVEYFNELLDIEKKKCERSRENVLFLLVDLSAFGRPSEREEIAALIMGRLSEVTRDTDIKGWHVGNTVAGVIFTHFTEAGKDRGETAQKIVAKCQYTIEDSPDAERLSKVGLSWCTYPEDFLRASSGFRLKGRDGNRQKGDG